MRCIRTCRETGDKSEVPILRAFLKIDDAYVDTGLAMYELCKGESIRTPFANYQLVELIGDSVDEA